MKLTLQVFFPLATAAYLLHIRQKYSLEGYILATLPFLAAGLFAWAHDRDIILYYNGPLMASGFKSWAAPVAIASIAILCVFRMPGIWWRTSQILMSFVIVNFWIFYAGWIS